MVKDGVRPEGRERNVYDLVERITRRALAGRRSDFIERCVTLMVWLARRHGPHGVREFPVDRRALPCARIFQDEHGRPLLTEDMIRTALAALRAAGLLVYAAEQRWKNAFRRFADVYRLGERISTLFPKARSEAPSDSKSPVEAPKGERVSRSPLVRGTCYSVIPKPFQRIPKPKTMTDLLLAKAEAAARNLPKLSPAALRAFSLSVAHASDLASCRAGFRSGHCSP